MVQKISITTMLLLMFVVVMASVIATTYVAASLGLIKYPSQQLVSTGLVTVSVRAPADVTVKGGEVLVNVIPENKSGGEAGSAAT